MSPLYVFLGYGHLTPTTTASKLFCVLYTLVGVPAGAAQLACTGQHLRTRLVALHRSKPWYPKDKNKDQMIKVSQSNPKYPMDKHKEQMFKVSRSRPWYPTDKNNDQMIKVSQSNQSIVP